MAMLDQRLVYKEDLVFVLQDFDEMFGGPNRPWAWRTYRVKGAPDFVYLVAYESKEELEEKERFR